MNCENSKLFFDQNAVHTRKINQILRSNFCYRSAKLEGVHKEFQKAVRSGVCHFDASRGVLILLSKIEGSQKLAEMIQEIYFRNLSQKVSFKHLKFLCTMQ